MTEAFVPRERRMAGVAVFGTGAVLTTLLSLLFRAADAVLGSKLKAGFFRSEAEARAFLSSLRERRAGPLDRRAGIA